MTITKYQLKEFQRLHKKHFGKTITKEQAMSDAMALIRLVYITQSRKAV